MGAVFLIKMTRKYVSLLLLLPSISSGYKIVETIDASGSSERQTIEDGPFGGSGGSPWTDGGEVHLNGDISSISMRSGSEVDAITVKYGDTWGPEHGGGGGSAHTFSINDGAVLGPVGGGGGGAWVSTFPGCYLAYLSGSAGSRLDSITLHWECP